MRTLLVNCVLLTLSVLFSCKNNSGGKVPHLSDSIKNNQYLKATESRYSNEIEKNPAGSDAFAHRALTRIMLKDYKGALSDCESAIKVDPKKCPYFIVGEAKAGLKDYAGAIRAYSSEIAAHPNDDICYRRRADAEQKKMNYIAALQDYDSAIRLNPACGYTYQLKGLLELKMNRKNDACADFKNALDLGVKNAGTAIKACCK
jgi:tetratricopeptide (TPR) repeat protein